jgi:hypothetical protein
MLTTPIATSDDGTFFVKRGSTYTIAMVNATSPSIVASSSPPNQSPTTAPSRSRNILSCDRKTTIARPLTKPIITGCGTNRISRPSFSSPMPTWIAPIRMTASSRYSKPAPSPPRWLPAFTSATITTASDPAAEEIIPGRPPNAAVIRQTMKPAYKPEIGGTPATKAKAIEPGTKASAVVRPASASSFQVPRFF